ncbi:MAG: hypothetical protein U9N49_12900 [Campylobacterota bacterium]|nr:hypothetical protein [Campylobacterota bacterium]
MSEKKEKFIHRENPPSLSMGFRVGIMNHDICIIDFLDNPDKDVLKAFSAIMLTKDGAKDLVEKLNHFINKE